MLIILHSNSIKSFNDTIPISFQMKKMTHKQFIEFSLVQHCQELTGFPHRVFLQRNQTQGNQRKRWR